jgi:hypothetical protein
MTAALWGDSKAVWRADLWVGKKELLRVARWDTERAEKRVDLWDDARGGTRGDLKAAPMAGSSERKREEHSADLTADSWGPSLVDSSAALTVETTDD